MKRIVLRILGGIFLLWLCFIAWGAATAWYPLPTYQTRLASTDLLNRILDGDDYGAIINSHARPLIVQAKIGEGEVLVYGAEHTKDPLSPSLNGMRTSFDEFQPTAVLCEGRMTGLLFPAFMDPVKTFGESGFVRAMAYENGAPVWTWEPTAQVEVDGLLAQDFTKEQVALRVILNPLFSNRRFGEPDDPSKAVEESIRLKADWPVIGKLFSSTGDIEKTWKKHFPEGPDWRDVSDEFGLPGFMAKMDSNLVRDRHLLSIITDLTSRGERVFVVAGCSHAAKLQPALEHQETLGRK